MIEKTIGEIESKIRAGTIGDERKRELLQLLARLKTEIAEHQKQNLKPLKHSVEELRSSIGGFEKSHPKLVQTVNSISNTLANLGI
jgi:uncharacterized coiled-coil DUF342 family protein